jgi:UPF0716 family protein affecting phage T7 exclusion
MDIMQYVRPELAILIAVCWVVGAAVKAIPKIANWAIPFILTVFAIVLAIFWIGAVLGEGFALAVIVAGVVQGILIAAVAVYGDQIIKQLKNDKNGKQILNE